MIDITSLFITMLRMSIPLLIAAMGGVFASRSGMMTMGLESFMLTGAFTGVLISYLTNNVLLAFLVSAVTGMLCGLLYAFLTIRMRVKQVICGIGLNLLIAAVTTILLQVVWKNSGNSPGVKSLTDRIKIPVIGDLPVIGSILNAMSINFYLAILFIFLTWYVIFRTSFGLRLRMVGENPTAASTLGIRTLGYKYAAMAICGALAGYAGAYLSIDQLNLFTKDMVAGRGFIVVVMLALGKYHPIGVVGAALLFGCAESLQINLQQIVAFPSQLIQTIPYVVTLLVLIFGVKHVKGPAGMGKFPEE